MHTGLSKRLAASDQIVLINLLFIIAVYNNIKRIILHGTKLAVKEGEKHEINTVSLVNRIL